MSKNSIIIYVENKKKEDIYLKKLNLITKEIRLIDEIHKEIINKLWDSNIKYRRFLDKPLSNFTPHFYLEKGKWTDFILIAGKFTENKKTKMNPFTLEELSSTKLKTTLLLFWRDIVNNLSSDTFFKLQLKLELTFSIDELGEYVNLTSDYNKFIVQIRSIGSVKVYSKKDYYEVLTYLQGVLYLSLDNYSFYCIKSVILTYNICQDDSILKTLKLSNKNLSLLNLKHTKNIINKIKLKINDSKLPSTSDLSQWGKIKKIEGDYPYKFNSKETRLLVYNDKDTFSTQKIFNNYIVSIKGIISNGKKIILHKVSVTNKNFKVIISLLLFLLLSLVLIL